MVQTVYYYLDSNPESRNFNNAVKLHSEKFTSAKHNAANSCVEPIKVKGNKSRIKLQPLNAKVENNIIVNTAEKKLSHRLNPLPDKPIKTSEQKKLSSKIPVLQRKTATNSKQKNEDSHCDNTLSAADRRQKFHQSRLRVADVCTNDKSPGVKIQATLNYDALPWCEGYVVHKVIAPPVPLTSQKNILPPIKPVEVPVPVEVAQKINQPKNKCLQGEITHFPALCNPLCTKRRKNYVSTVPHLPPILPPPAAPPPSISTSLEKDGNKISHVNNHVKKNEEWNISKLAFNKIVVH